MIETSLNSNLTRNPLAVEYFNTGILLARKGELRNAISFFRKAIQLEPDWLDPHGHLAFAYFNFGWINQAIQEYNYLISKNQNNAEIHLLVGNAYQIFGNSPLSSKHQTIAKELDEKLCRNYSPLQVKQKNFFLQYKEEIPWLIRKGYGNLKRFHRLIYIYRILCYYLDLILVFFIDLWRKYIQNFYNPSWTEKDSIKITLFDLLRFLKKYQVDFMKSSYLYCRSIEYVIGLNWISAKSGNRIIDLGAGHSSMLAALIPYGCEVHITDGDPYIFEIKDFLAGTSLDSSLRSGKLVINQVDATDTQYPDNHFDRIVSIGALEHLPDDNDKLAFKEVARMLRPGGYALITLEAAYEYREEWITMPYHVGVQYSNNPTSLTDTSGFRMFIRFYDDTAIQERVVKSSGLQLIQFGYFADILPLRAWFENLQNVRVFGHFQPLLSAFFYRHYKTSLELKGFQQPIVYVLLKKPSE